MVKVFQRLTVKLKKTAHHSIEAPPYRKLISKLRSVTCHMRSHSVTCRQPHLNPIQTGRYSIYLHRRDERPS